MKLYQADRTGDVAWGALLGCGSFSLMKVGVLSLQTVLCVEEELGKGGGWE